MSATVATFNCEWRRTKSSDAAEIRQLVNTADVVCLTEAYRDFFGGHGYTIEATPPAGSRHEQSGRRKVLLWSRSPWVEVDATGPESVAPGRFVSGVTQTPVGPVTFMGLCIPWPFCDVPEARPWQRHLEYLAGIEQRVQHKPGPLVVLGDFNQRIPRVRQPRAASAELDRVLTSHLDLASGGLIEGIGQQAIDHVCFTRNLQLVARRGLSNVRSDGGKLSDHFGVQVEIANGPSPQANSTPSNNANQPERPTS